MRRGAALFHAAHLAGSIAPAKHDGQAIVFRPCNRYMVRADRAPLAAVFQAFVMSGRIG